MQPGARAVSGVWGCAGSGGAPCGGTWPSWWKSRRWGGVSACGRCSGRVPSNDASWTRISTAIRGCWPRTRATRRRYSGCRRCRGVARSSRACSMPLWGPGRRFAAGAMWPRRGDWCPSNIAAGGRRCCSGAASAGTARCGVCWCMGRGPWCGARQTGTIGSVAGAPGFKRRAGRTRRRWR